MSHTNTVTSSFPGALAARGRGRRPFLSIAALLRATGLDRQLASGVEPWRTPLLAARSRQLTSDRKRRLLARGMEQLIEQAEEPGPARVTLTAAVSPSRPRVREARPLLLMLAARLRAGAPIDPRAVAALNNLLTDGAGPVYAKGDPNTLALALRRIESWLDA